jgi:Transcription factor zinc-finger
MADEKDHYGEKLHDKAKVHADQWARQQDAELLDKMRNKAVAAMHCPQCGKDLIEKTQVAVRMFACPQNDGAWIDGKVLEILLKK